MKILHVLTSARAEGTPRLVLDWLSVKDHEQHVLFLNNSPSDLIYQFHEVSKNVHVNKSVPLRIFSRIFKIPIVVRRKCKQIKPDLVIAWNQPNVHFILAGAKLAGVNKLLGHAGCLPEKNKLFGWTYTYFVFYSVFLLNAKIICPSNHICSTFFRILFFPKSTLKVVPNAINLERFIKKNADIQIKKNSAIYVANLESAKDHELLIEAWVEVIRVIPDATLIFAGQGSLERNLKELTFKLKCNDSITFLGARNDIPELLWNTELFVFPSKNVEGFGTVLIEALAAGLKIVAFDEPAPKELLRDNLYGVLVKQRTAKALANAIVLVFGNQQSIEQKNKGIRYAQTFNVEVMIENYLKLS